MLNYDPFTSKVFVLFLFQSNHSHCAERETTVVGKFSVDSDISKEGLSRTSVCVSVIKGLTATFSLFLWLNEQKLH